MKRLSGADAFTLAMETPRAYMHTLKIAILDPSTDPEGWSFDRFYREAESRLPTLPLLRWKCVDAPLGMQYWVDDPDFDPHYHIRRVACPQPGDHRALCEFISSIYAYQLDRDRPLWMQWIVEGLEGGKVALVMMLHHAYVDGVGAAWLMQQFYQPRAGTVTEAARAWTPEPLPSRLQLWGHALRDLPMVLAKHLPSAALGVARKLRLERRYAKAGKPHPSAGMMKQTPINQILSPGRTFVCDNLSLADFQRVGKSLGYTVNDVFSACSAGAVRKLLKDMNYDPDQHPLIAGVPFAGKRPPGMEGIGNYVTVDFCWLRSDLADPRERLEASRVANLEMKEHLKTSAEAGADLASVIQALPPVVMRGVRRLIHRMDGKVGFFGNVGLSNVPGPKESLYLNKWKVSDWYSVGQVVDGTAINLTMWSYAGKACVCLMLDRAVVPDGWKLFNYFAEELAQLVALVPQQPEKNTV